MLEANLLNLFDQKITYARISVSNGRIDRIDQLGPERPGEPYVLPGFVDAHVHVESSLLTPPQFARLAVVHGTVATVSDPHEIGNVLGVAGVEYMIAEGKRVPFKFMFGAPSCVPATPFETAGATITPNDVRYLLGLKEIGYLAEVMNFPGVLNGDADMMAKIALAKAFNKPIDGHAPGLTGDAAQQYTDAGITTDHECFTYEEGLDKARRGMQILIREGSAARNFDTLIPLLAEFPTQIMFCSDDKHPDTLAMGHIDQLVRRALAQGHSLWNVLRAACLNPVLHYRLPVGLLREGDPADFIVVDSTTDFRILRTVIDGETVAENGFSHIPDLRSEHVNQFSCSPKTPDQLAVLAEAGATQIRVIEALDGQLVTNELLVESTIVDGKVVPNIGQDVLKLVVVNRYKDAPPSVGFIKNFGLTQGAIASSVGHDSHNITAVGCDDESLCRAINLVINAQGGLSAVSADASEQGQLLPLPVAGLMTDADGYDVAAQYSALDNYAKQALGSTLAAPFMTLSFMALLVIPSLKLSDLALFDGNRFSFTQLQITG
ncbi:adenine deaminase [Spirosoma rhododendri]|uniref:Adenine deaminase n=1 Tax=Spirosoma rhododendri TaxID=2728024 RepID=A0A7L5DQR4_9BACT|nr:adenine deaminase [Spirosoma rhododendri]QJD80779.1 adenine deaminase [Spirosoma rhododendri]